MMPSDPRPRAAVLGSRMRSSENFTSLRQRPPVVELHALRSLDVQGRPPALVA
jgi:hypothetical protein